MRFLKFTLIILSTPFLFAQSFNKVYVSSGTEFFKDVFKTNVRYDAFGMTNSGRSAGNYDLLFTKLDSCGEVINAYAYGDLKSVDFEIHMPNVFTPNGDSLNDYFRPIVYEKVGDAVLTIYNRWGEKIFETVNVEKGWDGQYRDKQVPDGVYMWLLEYRDPRNNDSQKEFMSGTVTIIR